MPVPVWTAEHDSELERLYQTGMSYGLIAETMRGSTNWPSRSAVLGRARRLHFGARFLPRAPAVVKKQKRRPVIPAPRPQEPQPRPPCSIYDLRADSCRWPLGPRYAYPPYMFCGHCVTLDGGCTLPYCDEHRRKAKSHGSKCP